MQSGDADWIDMAQDTKWWARVNMIMNLQFW